MEDLEVCRYHDDRRAVILVRCDDCRGGLIRRLRTLSTFAFYEHRPRVAVTAGINPPGWTKPMWKRMASLIRNRGWEAASHSMDHPWLTRESEERARDELATSRDVIRAELASAGLDGIDVPTFIYPFGDYGPREIGLLGQTGYALALTYMTEEDVVEIPDREAFYEWGYTLNAPERQTLESMLERFREVYETGKVFSVTTHPPVVRPDRRFRAPNVYKRSGSWARLLDELCAIPDVWFTTFGTLAAYHLQASSAEVRRVADGIEVRYTVAERPLPRPPLTIAFTSRSAPASVLLDDVPIPRHEAAADLPKVGWRYEAGHVTASLPGPGLLSIIA